MSDPRREKVERELRQVRAFLASCGVDFTGVVPGPDMPDVLVYRSEGPPLAIEVTEYHPQSGRVGMQKRADQFREVLDRLIEERPHLKGVNVRLSFQDDGVPRLPRHATIAEELVRCIEDACLKGWVGRDSLQL